MGGAVSSGQDNEELVDNLCHEGYIVEPQVEKVWFFFGHKAFICACSSDWFHLMLSIKTSKVFHFQDWPEVFWMQCTCALHMFLCVCNILLFFTAMYYTLCILLQSHYTKKHSYTTTTVFVVFLATLQVFRMIDRADYMIFQDDDEKLEAYEDHAWRRGMLHLSAPCIYTRVVEALKFEKGILRILCVHECI